MTNRELVQALRSAASALEHGRMNTYYKKIKIITNEVQLIEIDPLNPLHMRSLELHNFIQENIIDAWAEKADNNKQIDGSDAIEYLVGLVHDARELLIKLGYLQCLGVTHNNVFYPTPESKVPKKGG